MRIKILCLLLALLSGGSILGCKKNDCNRLAELSCSTAGTSDEDCRAAKAAAKRAKTDAEIQACGVVLKAFQESAGN